MENVEKHEKQLLKYTLSKLGKIKEIEIYNPGYENGSGIISFNIKGIHPHDVASVLNHYGVAIRAGHCCAIPLMKKLNINGVCRISFYVYNNYRDVDKFIEAINILRGKFKNVLG
jgi:cysteine desulfurase/selenocysteine lyase